MNYNLCLVIGLIITQTISTLGGIFLFFFIKITNEAYDSGVVEIGALKKYVFERYPAQKQKLFFGGLVYLEETPTKRFLAILNIASCGVAYQVSKIYSSPLFFYLSLFVLAGSIILYYWGKHDLNIYSEEPLKKFENFDSDPP